MARARRRGRPETGVWRRSWVVIALVAALPAASWPGRAVSSDVALPLIHGLGDDAFDADGRLVLETRLDRLPEHGRPRQPPWNAYWWPYNKSGLNHRGIAPDEPSPAEKMDLATGHPGAMAEWERARHPANVEWGGQCDGFAIASVLEPEPREPVFEAGVCFTAGDVKGLLGALYMGDMLGQRVDVVGRNVQDPERRGDDLDPASFHLALANVVGLHHQGLYLDVGHDGEIYNKPLAHYASQVERQGAQAVVTTRLDVVRYLLAPEVEAHRGPTATSRLTLTYTLDLDADGHIQPGRGAWLGGSVEGHPSALKIPRGSPLATALLDPFIDVELVRRIAARSAAIDAPECWPELAAPR